jgi:hypothetical protein
MLFDNKRWTMPQVPAIEETEWRAVLRKAADAIKKRGWVQGSMELDGKMCVHGAMSEALFGCPHYMPWDAYPLKERERVAYGDATRKLYAVLCRKYSKQMTELRAIGSIGADDVTAWNDHPDTTKRMVLKTLREAASA